MRPIAGILGLIGSVALVCADPVQVQAATACTTTIIPSKTPPFDVCGVASGPSHYNALDEIQLPEDDPDPTNTCLQLCLKTYDCLSFALTLENLCVLIWIKYSYGKNGGLKNTTAHLYNVDCFGSNCTFPTPTLPPYQIPTSTCNVDVKSPYPTPYACGQVGHLESPSLIEAFFVGPNAAAGSYFVFPLMACLQPCLTTYNQTCMSVSMRFFDGYCQLYRKSIADQGLSKGDPRPRVRYYDVECFTTKCSNCFPSRTATTRSRPTTTSRRCIPTSTQAIRNPSFEDSPNGAPWTFGNGTRLVQNNPQNASDGSSYVVFQRPAGPFPIISMEQTLTNLEPSRTYNLRFFVNVVENILTEDPVCYLDILVDGNSVLADLDRTTNFDYSYSYYFKGYFPGLVPLKVNRTVANLKFSLKCPYSISYPATLFFDNITLTYANTGCPFALQVVSTEPSYNNMYIYAPHIPSTFHNDFFSDLTQSISNASVWYLDGSGILHLAQNNLQYYATPYADAFSPNDGSGPFVTFLAKQVDYGLSMDPEYNLQLGFSNFPLCSVSPQGILECREALSQRPYRFRYCNACQLDANQYRIRGLYYVYDNDTVYYHCPYVSLRVVHF